MMNPDEVNYDPLQRGTNRLQDSFHHLGGVALRPQPVGSRLPGWWTIVTMINDG